MPGFKDFVDLTVLTESDLDDYLAKQVVMKFASPAARDAALAAVLREGMVVSHDDVNGLAIYSGAAWSTLGPLHGVWTSFTTTWSGTLGNGTNSCRYMRIGRTIFYRIRIVWGSTTSHAAATQTFTLPVAPSSEYTQACAIGTASALDSGTGQSHGTATMTSTASTIDVQIGGGSTKWSNTNPHTWATNDIASIVGEYEAAADA